MQRAQVLRDLGIRQGAAVWPQHDTLLRQRKKQGFSLVGFFQLDDYQMKRRPRHGDTEGLNQGPSDYLASLPQQARSFVTVTVRSRLKKLQ